MTNDLTEAVRRAVCAIPEGTVATYGQIADAVGTGPRQVGRALRLVPDGRACPWHRVVNAHGRISDHGSEDRQRRRLEQEGIEFDDLDRIDLNVYGWDVSEWK